MKNDIGEHVNILTGRNAMLYNLFISLTYDPHVVGLHTIRSRLRGELGDTILDGFRVILGNDIYVSQGLE
jgi:hypothetical protein